jgi:hypothetical protein
MPDATGHNAHAAAPGRHSDPSPHHLWSRASVELARNPQPCQHLITAIWNYQFGLLDQSALFGVLAEIDALGLRLIEVSQPVPEPE